MCPATGRKGRVVRRRPAGSMLAAGPPCTGGAIDGAAVRNSPVTGRRCPAAGTGRAGTLSTLPQHGPDERECVPRRHVRAGGCGARGLGWARAVRAHSRRRVGHARCRASCTDARPGRAAARRSHAAACVHTTSKLNQLEVAQHPFYALCSVPILPRPLALSLVPPPWRERDVTCARRETLRQT